jgi:hypothetical protein
MFCRCLLEGPFLDLGQVSTLSLWEVNDNFNFLIWALVKRLIMRSRNHVGCFIRDLSILIVLREILHEVISHLTHKFFLTRNNGTLEGVRASIVSQGIFFISWSRLNSI